MAEGYTIRAMTLGASSELLDDAEVLRALKTGRALVWIHVTAIETEPTRVLLEETFGFHALEVEDALSPHERPTLQVANDSIFLVAPAIELGGAKERFVEIAFFCRDHVVVTVVTHPLPLLDHWFDRCTQTPAASGRTPALLVHALLDAIVDGYFPAIDELGEEIDQLEEAIYAGRRVNVADALLLKRRLLEVRRQVTPIRDILNGLLRREIEFIGPSDRPYYQDVYDHVLRIAEIIDMERDILASVLDAHLSIVSNNLNQVMRTLTVVSTVLMTGAFIAGVYGMNFKHMPELDWKIGYPLAVSLMVSTGALEVWYFKRRGWM